MKKLFLIGLILLCCLPLVLGVFTATMQTPTTGVSKTGSIAVFNVTIGNDYGGKSVSNITCAFFIRATDTANSTYILMANITNSTEAENVSITGVNITYDTTQLEDSSSAQTYVTCYNMTIENLTGGVDSTVVTFVLDNYVPTITSITPSDASTDTDGDVTFTVNIPTANATSATLIFTDRNPGNRAYSMTEGTDQFTVSLTNIPEQRYNWYVSTTDGLNSTSSSIYELIVDDPPSSARRLGAATALAQTSPDVTQTGPRTFVIAGKPSVLQSLSIIGDNLTQTKWGPFSPIVWIVLIVIGLGAIYIKTKKS